MATIFAAPTYNFAGNFAPIIVATNNPVEFVLLKNDAAILSETYTAQNSRVVIKLKAFFEAEVTASALNAESVSVRQIDTFRCLINDEASETFHVLPGGVDGNIDTAMFLKNNFLTWQPQTRHTTFHAPHWLRYVATEGCKLMAKAYFTDGTDQTKEIASMASGNVYTFDVSYGAISGRFTKQVTYYDIWVAGTDRLTYVQRYVLAESYEISDDYFVFENTLGGFDTARFFGEGKEITEAEGRVSVIEETTTEHDIDFKRSWQKSTGYIPDEASRAWIVEFFSSRCRFRVGRSSLERIFVSKPKMESIRGELGGYEFTYALAKTTKYLNLDRGELPTNIQITNPSGELFFLEPRLSQFPAVAGNNFLIPAQYPASEKWHTISFAALVAIFMDYAINSTEGQTYPAEKHARSHAPGGVDSLGEYYAPKEHAHKDEFHPYKGNLQTPLSASQITARLLEVLGKSKLQDVEARSIDALKGLFKQLTISGSASSPEFVSGFLSGKGWAITQLERENAAGETELKSYAEFDDLVIRGGLKVFELIINQLKGESDNYIFSGMMRIDHLDTAAAPARIWLDTGGGVLYNPFRAGDILVCQRFGGMPTAENDYNVIKQYEFVVTDSGCGSLGDGEQRLDWIEFANLVGDSGQIAKGDIVVRVDSMSDPRRKGVIMNTTIGDFAPYQDVVYGLKTDPKSAVKVRTGNLAGVYNPWFGWLRGFGLYAQNFYGIGEFHLSTGENIGTRLDIIENLFRVSMQNTVYNMSEADNLLANATFTENMEHWERLSNIAPFSVNGLPLMLGSNIYTAKNTVAAVVDYNGRNVLRLKKSGIRQRNAKIVKPAADSTLYLSFKFICKTAGTLRYGFENQTKEGAIGITTRTITAGREFETVTLSGTWDGRGDFVIEFSGDIYIDLLSLTNRPLDDFAIKVSTQFEQTSDSIKLLGQRVDGANNNITNLGIALDATRETLDIYANRFNGIDGSINQIGLRLNAVDGQIDLYGNRLDAVGRSVTNLGLRINTIEGSLTTYVQSEEFNDYREGVDETLELHRTAIEQTDRTIQLAVSRGVGFPMYRDINLTNGANSITSIGDAVETKWIQIHSGDYVPSESNLPFSSWSPDEQLLHHEDIFIDTATGQYYQLQLNPWLMWVPVDPEGWWEIMPSLRGLIRIRKYVGDATPGLGGFGWETPLEKGKIYQVRFTAMIPLGFSLNVHGEGSQIDWATERIGTGDWAEYKVQVSPSVAEPVSIYLTRDLPTVSDHDTTLDWWVSSATVFDLSGYEDPVSSINLSEEEIKIKGKKIALEGAISANGTFGVDEEGNMYATSGTFGGFIRTPLMPAAESDAIRSGSATYPEYTLLSNLNIISCLGGGELQETFYLPTDGSYEGAHVCIHNACYPPYTKTMASMRSTVIRTADGRGIRGFAITGDTSLWSDPVGMSFMNGYVELFATPRYLGGVKLDGIDWTFKAKNTGIFNLIR